MARLLRSRGAIGVALVLPATIMAVGFFFIPLGLMIWMSLNRWPMLGSRAFVGATNVVTTVDTTLPTGDTTTLPHSAAHYEGNAPRQPTRIINHAFTLFQFNLPGARLSCRRVPPCAVHARRVQALGRSP